MIQTEILAFKNDLFESKIRVRRLALKREHKRFCGFGMTAVNAIVIPV